MYLTHILGLFEINTAATADNRDTVNCDEIISCEIGQALYH